MTSASTEKLVSIVPCFIVRDLNPAIAFYQDRLGFDTLSIGPDDDPYWAIVRRDGVSIMLKAIAPDILPMPNSSRHRWARWDAYIYTADPDALTVAFTSRGVSFREPLGVNSDQLRGFEVVDADGFVLYFGRPD